MMDVTAARSHCLVASGDGTSHTAKMGSVHHPFRDASKQIRLLKAIEDESGSVLKYELSTVDFGFRKRQQSFYAISYTWGDNNNPRSIVINNKTFNISQNCFYALWQTRLHYAASPIWIDAVCINQTDLIEKSAQVAIMGDIYRSAALVLICVGPHFDDSKRVIKWAKKAEADLPKLRLRYPDHDATALRYIARSRAWRPKPFSNDAAFLNFTKRGYWKRLWVAQEIALATEKVVLCGEDVIHWSWMEALSSILHSDALTQNDEHCSEHFQGFGALTQEISELRDVALDSLLPRLYKLECDDPRDRIYGLLSLSKESDRMQVIPDYTISEAELARRVAKLITMESLPILLIALGLSSESGDIQQLIEQGPSTELTRVCYHLPPLRYSVSPIWTNADGQLESNLILPPESWFCLRNDPEFPCSALFPSTCWTAGVRTLPGPVNVQCITESTQVVAVVCPEAQGGDLLLQIYGPLLLVLRIRGGRHRNDDSYRRHYDIVGQGFLACDARFSWVTKSFPEAPMSIELLLPVEDAIALLAPEVCSDVTRISLGDRVRRLQSPVTHWPLDAARVAFPEQLYVDSDALSPIFDQKQ